MGAAGDMLMAALLELTEDKQVFLDKMNHLDLPGVKIQVSPSVKCGIRGTHVSVKVNGGEEESMDVNHEYEHEHEHHHHEHSHSALHEIEHLISGLQVSTRVKEDAIAVYRSIAEAESQVHGAAMDQIHFHEVGTLDAIADIIGVCLLMEQLAPQRIVASPIHVGSGFVRCAHGVLPVPAPATAFLLQGIPSYGGTIRGELCTPTGAALLKHFVSAFSGMPVLKTEKIGYGMGNKDFEAANCVRAFYGESADASQEIVELVCNLDDMTPEALGFAQSILFEAGALDVFVTPITMKKGRPAMMLTCLAKTETAETMAALILKHTSTIGVRQNNCKRYILTSNYETVQTEFGPIQLKTSSGYGVRKTKAEFDDVARAAREHHVTMATVLKALQQL